MNIAVTGANGHVGVNLCRSLSNSGYKVRALAHKHKNGLHGLDIELVQGDMLDKSSLYDLVKGADVVFHLAARISITGDPDGMVNRINASGTRNLLDVATECRTGRFIHFSSIHAFQQHPFHEPLDETRPLVTNEGFAYDRSKASGERMVMEEVRTGLNAVILSPTAIIGPDDHEPSLIGQAVIDVYNNKIPSLVPGGYDWVDVRDIVDAAINAITKARTGEKYLLSGKWASLKEFSALISSITGKKTVSAEVPIWLARVGLPFITMYGKLLNQKPLYTSESLTIISEGNRMISNEKARRELNFSPRPLEDSWLKQQGKIN